MNFTGVELDKTVAWSSWYQLIESYARVKTHFDDPITELFLKIKTMNPAKIAELDHNKSDQSDFIIDFGDFKITNKLK